MLNTAKSTKITPLTKVFGRTEPQVTEIEIPVLGALILEKGALNEVIDILKPEAFYHDAHQIIYKTITKLYNKDKGYFDFSTIKKELEKNGKLDQIGGISYLCKLTHNVASAAHIQMHALMIMEYYLRREFIKETARLHHTAYDESIDTFDLFDDLDRVMFNITEKVVKKVGKTDDLSEFGALAIKEAENFKGGFRGLCTGFSVLDEFLRGLKKGQLVAMVGRPGMGKTNMGIQTARNIAINEGKAVGIISLEMKGVELAERLYSAEAEVETTKFKENRMSEEGWAKFYEKTEKLNNAKIKIQEASGVSLLDIRKTARSWKKKHGIECLVIDYLQLINYQEPNRYLTREQEVAKISKGLKEIAQELEIPVICLCQLNRALESRGGDKRPALSDIRDSGAVEQDADVVLGLYRPEYYGITEDEKNMPTEGIAEILILKNRAGRTGKVTLGFRGEYAKFTNLETKF